MLSEEFLKKDYMPKTCIVIPCYNEAKRLSIDKILAYLSRNLWMDICFVDDGSADGTIKILKSIKKELGSRIFIVQLKQNSGKAEAVRIGVLKSFQIFSPDFVGYLDADLSTPFVEIERFLHYAGKYTQVKMFSGCRLKRLGAEIDRKCWRHYIGRVFATAASLILDLPAYDTQCGAKIFQSEIAAEIFSRPFLSSWFFDVEIFARIKKIIGKDLALKQIMEIPLHEWKDKSGSKLRLRHYFICIIDLWRIFLNYR